METLKFLIALGCLESNNDSTQATHGIKSPTLAPDGKDLARMI